MLRLTVLVAKPKVSAVAGLYQVNQLKRKASAVAGQNIRDEFIHLCREARIDTSKTLVQIKEKWRGIFDKYK